MKKLILLLAAVALATSVWAQDTPKKPSFAGFVSNGFWDNWEITLGGGAGTALSNGTNQGSFGDRINFEANFGLTKWFHPVTGMRLQLQGGRFANFDDVLGKAKWPYLFVHADFMLNFSNWAGGYREDRAYYAVPFAGFGYMASNFTDKSHENNGSGTHQSFAFTLGWLNKFRISPSFDFNIELKGLIAPSRVRYSGWISLHWAMTWLNACCVAATPKPLRAPRPGGVSRGRGSTSTQSFNEMCGRWRASRSSISYRDFCVPWRRRQARCAITPSLAVRSAWMARPLHATLAYSSRCTCSSGSMSGHATA